jgi:hypothetical protein
MYVVYDQSDPNDTNPALEFSLGLIETIEITGSVATLGIAVLGYKVPHNISTEVGWVYECVAENRSDKAGQFVWRKLDSGATARKYKKVVADITSECVSWVNHFGDLFQRGRGRKPTGGVFLKKCVVGDCFPKYEEEKVGRGKGAACEVQKDRASATNLGIKKAAVQLNENETMHKTDLECSVGDFVAMRMLNERGEEVVYVGKIFGVTGTGQFEVKFYDPRKIGGRQDFAACWYRSDSMGEVIVHPDTILAKVVWEQCDVHKACGVMGKDQWGRLEAMHADELEQEALDNSMH